jgi:copper chaperone CopZ
MLILTAALAALLATPPPAIKPPSPTAQPAIIALGGPELAHAIKAALEPISGPGSVNVSTMNIHGKTQVSVGIAIPDFNSKICSQIYDRELDLNQLFPEQTIDFYFDGPELARAIKADIESISGRDTVDVSIDSKTLFNVRIAVPVFSSDIYNQLFDRELELYRAFRDLSFDFYLRPK